MEHYTNNKGNSGVQGYSLGQGLVLVEFKDGSVYEYTSLSTSQQNIEHMGRLAIQGEGLNAFINRVVRKGYSRKIR